MTTPADRRLSWSTDRLSDSRPEVSARTLWARGQLRFLLGLAVLIVVGLLLSPRWTGVLLMIGCTSVYLAVISHRLILIRTAIARPDMIRISDAEAREFPEKLLPVYTVLVPAYGEPEVVGQLLANLTAIDYPRDKLDIKLLLEEDDHPTREAVAAAGIPPGFEVVVVPPAEPRTKPKACNYGLQTARGRYVTIYDAEDKPEPLQLRRAVVAFSRADPRTACLQAKLSYHNFDQNLITRWFTAEYDVWFSYLLSGLVGTGTPVPLGGTSNHIRRRALRTFGGWDPYNVTEDADLGIRLARAGLRVEVLDSVTMEEANSDFVNWVKQRSRWYKGYLQTFIVHTRDPRRLVREVGLKGALGFSLFVGGTPILAMLNPLFWGLAVLWVAGEPSWIAALFPPVVYHLALACGLLGNMATVYSTIVCNRGSGHHRLVMSGLLAPAYWVMMAMAAVKGALQLVLAPSHWEKTIHGLDLTKSGAKPSADEAS
ncbi:MAG: glycosyltransferase [Pseudonocardiales bacterium]